MDASSLEITGAGRGVVEGWTEGLRLSAGAGGSREGAGEGRAREEVLHAPRDGIEVGRSFRLDP